MSSQHRLHRLQSLLSQHGHEAYLVEQPLALTYLTGLPLSTGVLLVPAKGAGTLFVDGRYTQMAHQQSTFEVADLDPKAWGPWCQERGIRKLGVSAEHTSLARMEQITSQLTAASVTPYAVTDPIEELRIIKDADEIDKLRRAGQLTLQGIQYASSLFQEGVSESELAVELEVFWRRAGGEKLAFAPIIAFGANSAMPHYRAGAEILTMKDCALLDVGVVVDGYHGDCTRFFTHPGCPSQLLIGAAAVEEAKAAAIAAIAPGVPLAELDRTARAVLRKHGLETYFVHSLGHGIGLEIHEAPRIKYDHPQSKRLCVAGMVFTIEPGVYFPGIGGVRLEDTILVTERGAEVLTALS